MSGLSAFLDKFNIVRQIPIFQGLNWIECQRVARKVIISEYAKGELIRRQGDPPDFFYCLLSGRLQAYTTSPSGIKENLEFIHRGMHFGIISVLTGENHSLSFEAMNDSVVLKIAKDDFHQIMRSIPSLGIEFSQSLSRRVRSHVQGRGPIFESTIISIYSPTQGTGCSTYAMNLALSLERETKKKVILLNIHTFQGDSTESHDEKDVAPQWENAINLKDIAEDYERILAGIRTGELAIDLLNVIFDGREVALKKLISPLVSTLVGAYHYVIVDLPNQMDDFVLEALTQSDVIHLLAFDRRKDLDMSKKVIRRLQSAFRDTFRPERIRVLIRPVHNKVYLSYEELNRAIDFNVFTVLPSVEISETKDITGENIKVHEFDPTSEYMKSVQRIARQIGGVMVGLVLGGGAALGVAHVGVIRVLERENIPVDVVIGSSMGALVAALWSVGRSAEELEAVAREFGKKTNMMKLFDPVVPISGLIGGRLIVRWLRKHLGNQTFHGTKIPLKVVAYDLIRREDIIIESGSLVDAVRQSIAIPGVIEPVIKDGKIIIDGGVLNPLPTNVLAAAGIKKIIAVNVLQSPEDTSAGYDLEQIALEEKAAVPFSKSPFQYLGFRMGRGVTRMVTPNISDIIVRTLQASEYVIAEQSAQMADVVIHPDLVGINWFELYRVDDLIKSGEKATEQLLPQIRKLLE